MAVLNLLTECDAAVYVNGQYAGIIFSSEGFTIPLNGATSISALPVSDVKLPTSVYIDVSFHLRGNGIFSKWTEEIYELELLFNEIRAQQPPIIIKEEKWGDYIAAKCGEWFITESSSGERFSYPRAINDFTLLGEYAVLKLENTAVIVDKKMNCVFPEVHVTELNVSGAFAELVFTLGEMDSCEIYRKVNIRNFETAETRVKLDDAQTSAGRLRCFCQALRLGFEKEAMSFASPDISFSEISDFLGVFDRVDNVKYISASTENSLALRYKIDEQNYQYQCFDFILNDGLIFDIEQL